MRRIRSTLAAPLALGLVCAGAVGGTLGAGGAAASAPPHADPGERPAAFSPDRGPMAARGGSDRLRPDQRRARRVEVRRCRKLRKRTKRRRCLDQARAKYRRIARHRAKRRPKAPTRPTAVHRVLVTDNTTNAIQSSYFIPFEQIERDGAGRIKQPAVPSTLRIRVGEAVRFVWDDENRDSPHTIAPWSHPPGVNRWDFTFGASAALGVTFQRTFTVRGSYEFRCSLHLETQILELTVTR